MITFRFPTRRVELSKQYRPQHRPSRPRVVTGTLRVFTMYAYERRNRIRLFWRGEPTTGPIVWSRYNSAARRSRNGRKIRFRNNYYSFFFGRHVSAIKKKKKQTKNGAIDFVPTGKRIYRAVLPSTRSLTADVRINTLCVRRTRDKKIDVE